MKILRRALLPLTVTGALVLTASERPAAWGFEAHRFVAERAIELLPAPIKPFFERNRSMIVEHAIDPDLWRTAGWTAEPPNHFVDLDAYGPPPFDALPHDKDEAIKKFGREMVEKNGLLPWRLEEMYAKLVKAFADAKTDRPFARENIKFLSAVIAHYVSDAHVPFHAVLNYDGQLTNQHGIHSRFESELFERYRKQLKIKPAPGQLTRTPREFAFDTLTVSAGLVDPILAADLEAIGSGDVYDSKYYDRFFSRTRPTLERRLTDSIAMTAAVITKAWEEGGRPDLTREPPRQDRRRRQAAPATPATPPTP
jgi:hypothetical protein